MSVVVVKDDRLGDAGVGIALRVHDLDAAKRCLAALGNKSFYIGTLSTGIPYGFRALMMCSDLGTVFSVNSVLEYPA
jgi:hypothetical protein